jgi:nodulation protein E
MRRVAITGLGCVSALGIGVEPLWAAVRSGNSGVGPTNFPRWLNHHVKISAQVSREAVSSQLADRAFADCDPFAQFAILAADQAAAQAGLTRAELAGPRTAVIMGSGVGGIGTLDDGCYSFYALNQKRVEPLTVPRVMANAAASHVSMRYGTTGPTFAVASACSSASQAIGIGFELVRSGAVDRAIVGGSEACVTPATTRAWEALRVLTPNACRPFSRGRNGMVLGEGAGVVVLENRDAARARGVAPIASLLGYGTTSDANDLLRPDPNGAAAAMRLALESASLEPAAIQYINAHGTGTLLNDVAESQAVRQAFGASADRLCISSTKPIHGHALGAAGGLEIVVTIMAICDGFAPPTINWIEQDPDCNLDIVPNVGRDTPIGAAMSNSFAFGGINAAIIVGRPD